jgi:hypothetical protein
VKEEIDEIMRNISIKLMQKGEDPNEVWECIDQRFDVDEKVELMRFLKGGGDADEIAKKFANAFVRIKNG